MQWNGRIQEPYSYGELAVSDAIVSNKCYCLDIEDGRIQLKCTHSYYYQVQMAMFCMNARWHDFLLRKTDDFHCEWVEYNELFCTGAIPTLRPFYIVAILLELSLKR